MNIFVKTNICASNSASSQGSKTLVAINKNTKIMEEETYDKYQFSEELKDLHPLHIVTKDFKHIIEYELGSWKMFEPSKFVLKPPFHQN
jgi:hypothetical protein